MTTPTAGRYEDWGWAALLAGAVASVTSVVAAHARAWGRPQRGRPETIALAAVAGGPSDTVSDQEGWRKYDDQNIFAKIIRGEIPSYKIFETDHALAILDAFPSTPGHSLLIPKSLGAVSVMDMSPQDIANTLKELPRLTRLVMQATGAEGCNIVQNNGPASGQVVMHPHFHVIPRVEGDGLLRHPRSASAMLSPEEGKAILAKMHE